MHKTDSAPIRLKDHKAFFVGGIKTKVNNKEITKGSMYVEHFIPEEKDGEKKIILIHGGGQSGVGFLSTPDHRRGWAYDFLFAGYEVFIVDQPARGRSGYSSTLYGNYIDREMDYDDCERRFSSMKDLGNWPQAKKHTQWPDDGKRDSQFSKQFIMSQLNTMDDRIEIEEMSRVALKELLSIAGKSCVLGHSQGGPFCWIAGDVAPENIQALIAVEPNGPPFYNVVYGDHPQTHLKNNKFEKLPTDKDWYKTSSRMDRPGGVTYSALTFDPPLNKGEAIKYKVDEKDYGQDYVNCFLQDGEPRKLKNLSGLPILILSAEASYHAPYDHGTSNFLKQCGVKNSFVRLQDHNITGNGHMMMLEKNNHEIADFILKWVEKEAKF